MKLRIGPRTGLGVQASYAEHIPAAMATAMRMAYRELRLAGVTPTIARSVLLTAYEVGVATGTTEQDAWYCAVGDSATRHPSVRGTVLGPSRRLQVVPS